MNQFWKDFIKEDMNVKDIERKRQYLMEEAASMPEGWYKAFAADMVEELLPILVENDFLEEYTVLQVKEKFGGLRWYGGGFEGEIPQEYWDWIDKYEVISEITCVKCGIETSAATYFGGVPICEDCTLSLTSC